MFAPFLKEKRIQNRIHSSFYTHTHNKGSKAKLGKKSPARSSIKGCEGNQPEVAGRKQCPYPAPRRGWQPICASVSFSKNTVNKLTNNSYCGPRRAIAHLRTKHRINCHCFWVPFEYFKKQFVPYYQASLHVKFKQFVPFKITVVYKLCLFAAHRVPRKQTWTPTSL